MHTLFTVLIILVVSKCVLGDGVNWINPSYVMSYASHPDPNSAKAVKAIVSRARSSAKNGPFTITKGSVVAPSGKKQDYLSWAPYHWPDCRWCNKHGTGTREQSVTNSDTLDNSTDTSCFGDSMLDDPYDIVDDPSSNDASLYSVDVMPSQLMGDTQQLALRKRCYATDVISTSTQAAPTATSSLISSIFPNDQEAGAKRPSQAQSASCTPSPTSSMPPSATWTTCPYQARDGKVNPDRNQLYGLSQLNTFSQSTIDNALASVLDNNSDAAKNVARFIDNFFLNSNTGMLPNLAWGQTVRGPGQHGSYMGVLDFRVMVKVANAVQLLRTTRSQYWTDDKNSKMIRWTNSYIQWLDGNELGQRARKAVNNHSSFFYAQMAALKILIGDEGAAIDAVQAYFAGPFKEQIVSSGEQPFESTRTKPYHYRCFNLEAMLAVAKLGDYLGLNMWVTKTKYNSTIKTAIDYLITLDSGQEDPGSALPIVAAALAAYGDDASGTYKKFLETGGSQGHDDGQAKSYPYKAKTWWFYEQPNALQQSPSHRRRDIEAPYDDHALYSFGNLQQDVLRARPALISSSPAVSEITTSFMLDDNLASMTITRLSAEAVTTDSSAPGATSEPIPAQTIASLEDEDDGYYPEYDGPVVLHPDRPAPFMSTDAVELEEGIFVYWEQIRHLYDDTTPGKRSKWARW